MTAKKTFFSSKNYDLYLNIDSLTDFHAQDVVFDMNLAESRTETRVIFKLRGMLSSTFTEQMKMNRLLSLIVISDIKTPIWAYIAEKFQKYWILA